MRRCSPFRSITLENRSGVYCTQDTPAIQDNVAFVSINGICNTKEDSVNNGYFISDTIGGYHVNIAYNGTLGFIGDILECIANKLGIVTSAVRETINTLRSAIHQVGGVGSDGTVKVIAHSQGGIVLDVAFKHLNPEERSMLCVDTHGSGTLIKPEGLKNCRNYVAQLDPVPFLGDPIGYIAARLGLRSDVVFFDPKNGYLQHGFRDTYGEIFKRNNDDFIKNYIK